MGESPTKSQYEELGLKPAQSTIQRVMGSWNEAKEVAGLELSSQVEGSDGSIKPKPDDVEIPENEEWEALSPQQRWYYQNSDYRLAVKNERKKELQRWMFEYKRDECSCEICGEDYPACLNFHHVGEKEAEVSRMVSDGHSKANIKSEIANCVVFCANCHQKQHSEPFGQQGSEKASENRNNDALSSKQLRRRELRSWVDDFKASSNGCNRCDEDDPACLDFHHEKRTEKTRAISSLISFTSSKERLMEEMKKCMLLCRNCHRKEHYEVPAAPRKTTR